MNWGLCLDDNRCSTSLPGGNQVDGLPPVGSGRARKRNTGALSASWDAGWKRTQT